MAELEIPDDFRDDARRAWARYVDLLIPFRPSLYGYCRRLTGDPFDAEDLVQDTLVRGFGTLGRVHQSIENPRGYLIRIATHLWIDARRRRAVETRALAEGVEAPSSPAAPPERASELRDAGERLLQRLSPQERAAVLLKEAFDWPLAEIADVLGTGVGAVKAALHRGRGRLADASAGVPTDRPLPSAALVDRFVDRMAAADLDGLLALMTDQAVVEAVGSLVEVGRDQFSREGSWLWQSVHVHPDLPPEKRPKRWEAVRGDFRGEPLMLSFSPDHGREWLVSITRLEERDGRIARIRAYYFCPETMREVAETLGLKAGHTLYRFPFEALEA